MPQLLLTPIVAPDANKLEEAYEVVADLAWERGRQTFRVPKFFQYDGASVPAIAWQLIGSPFHPRFMIAAVFHDWLYHTQHVTRETADEILYELLLESGIGKAKAWMMKSAVQAAGGMYWGNDSDDKDYLLRLSARIRQDGRRPDEYGLVLN